MKILAVLCLAVALLCGCHAAGGLFTPAEDGTSTAQQVAAPIQQAVTQAANATGNPLIIALVGAGNLLLSGLFGRMARKGAQKDIVTADAAPYTRDDLRDFVARLKDNPDLLAQLKALLVTT